MHWIPVFAGILVLYFGFGFLFMKLISYLSRKIESKTTLFMTSGVLWFVVIFTLTGMDIPMTIAITVVQLGIVLPSVYRKFRKPQSEVNKSHKKAK